MIGKKSVAPNNLILIIAMKIFFALYYMCKTNPSLEWVKRNTCSHRQFNYKNQENLNIPVYCMIKNGKESLSFTYLTINTY